MSAEINIKNFKRICGLNGLTPSEVPGLIGKHKDTVYRALRNPDQFKPTIELINILLPVRKVPRVKRAATTS